MLKKLPANSFPAYALLAFIAMAGLSYINFLPGVVNALAGDIGFDDAEAGQVVALNGYGGLVGSTAAIFLVRRIRWQPAMFTFLAALTVVDIGTMWVADYGLMLGWRFFAGVLGGLCVGIGFSVLARLSNSDRAFGLLLFVQFSIGSLVIYLLPGLEAQLSAHAVFYVMASFAFLSLIFLLFLPALSLNGKSVRQTAPLPGLFGNSLLLLSAIILYQVAASAIWAYVGLIGHRAGIAAENVSLYIATTGLLGLLGAMLPVINGNRFGRLYWITAGIALSITASAVLSISQLTSPLYLISMALLFFSWPAVQSYLLAVTAEMDRSGRLSTIAAVVSSVGLATGPLLASVLLDGGSFSMMLYTCAVVFLMSFLLLFRPVQARENAETAAVSSQYQS
ncbi:MAG: MFS transporter [Pseudomonadota bacterium]